MVVVVVIWWGDGGSGGNGDGDENGKNQNEKQAQQCYLLLVILEHLSGVRHYSTCFKYIAWFPEKAGTIIISILQRRKPRVQTGEEACPAGKCWSWHSGPGSPAQSTHWVWDLGFLGLGGVQWASFLQHGVICHPPSPSCYSNFFLMWILWNKEWKLQLPMCFISVNQWPSHYSSSLPNKDDNSYYLWAPYLKYIISNLYSNHAGQMAIFKLGSWGPEHSGHFSQVTLPALWPCWAVAPGPPGTAISAVDDNISPLLCLHTAQSPYGSFGFRRYQIRVTLG